MTTIHNAAALIAEIDPALASLFVARPFHRFSIVSALFESMKASGMESAYRVRIVLNRAIEADQAVRAAALEDQL